MGLRKKKSLVDQAIDQASGMARRTMPGWKLKKVAITTSADTAPIGAAREAK